MKRKGLGDGMSHLEVEQIDVGRHVRIKAGELRLNIHANDGSVGAWLSEKGKVDFDCLSVFLRKGEAPYVQAYPFKEYFQSSVSYRLPFAFGTRHGLQIPHSDGKVTVISLEQLSSLAKLFEAMVAAGKIDPKTPVSSG